MHSFTTLATLALAASAHAAYGSSSSSSSTNSADSSAPEGVHVVKVGDGGLTFSPNSMAAKVGDVVEFHFYPQAHSVAQSSFAQPCQPLNTSLGFFSGPVPVSSGVGPQVFSVTVNDTKPMWFYCATGRHCQNGMVGVINPPANGNTVQMYAAGAAQAANNVAPSKVQGGVMGTAASSSPKGSNSPSAGVHTTGDAQFGLLTLGLAIAGMVGGFLV